MPQTERLNIIFHHPGPIGLESDSGSKVRPAKILEAFEQTGHTIHLIAGYGKERKKAIKKILNITNTGTTKFDFIYSESRSIPTLLSEKHRLPLYPILDFLFLLKMKKKGIPVGLFYRDIFWKFASYKAMLPYMGRLITIPLYIYDWLWYKKIVNHLFIPSMGMAKYLPSAWPQPDISPLPPGAPACIVRKKSSTEYRKLRLLYIGGVIPPTYDLSPTFQLFADLPDIELILCCRKKDWDQVKSRYNYQHLKNIRITHSSGQEIEKLYEWADIFLMFWQPDEYLSFAVPIKLFEAVGHNTPIITTNNTEAARIVEKQGLGWCVSNHNEMKHLLKTIQKTPQYLIDKQLTISMKNNEHTWDARVKTIISTMLNYCKKNDAS